MFFCVFNCGAQNEVLGWGRGRHQDQKIEKSCFSDNLMNMSRQCSGNLTSDEKLLGIKKDRINKKIKMGQKVSEIRSDDDAPNFFALVCCLFFFD